MDPRKRFGEILREMYMNRDMPEEKRALSDLYWKILLCFVFAITLLSIAYGVFEFARALRNPESSSINVSAVPPPSLDRSRLESTLEGFHSREGRFESLKAKAPTFADPSI